MKQITFTEDDIIEHHNQFTPLTLRSLPKNGKGAEHRTGICKCGKKSGPYASCKKCREHIKLHGVLMNAQKAGIIETVVDGRGRKGGRVWKKTAEFAAQQKAEKLAKIIRRNEPKIGRNEPCPCGSGKKHKKCCCLTAQHPPSRN